MKKWTFFALAFLTSCLTFAADTAPAAAQNNSSAVILKITGDIGNRNSKDGKSYDFTLEDLKKIGDKTAQATTQWAPPKSQFKGPLLREVLKIAGVKGHPKTLSLVCSDSYVVKVPFDDINKWDVIVSHTLNGKSLANDKNGPLWVMYPIDDNPKELDNDVITARIAWNLIKIVVK